MVFNKKVHFFVKNRIGVQNLTFKKKGINFKKRFFKLVLELYFENNVFLIFLFLIIRFIVINSELYFEKNNYLLTLIGGLKFCYSLIHITL